ncbi:MAG: hypothetical protein ACK4LB_02555 [Spirosomataceae bacterium]
MKLLQRSLLLTLSVSALWSCQTPPASEAEIATSTQANSVVARKSATPPYLQVLTRAEAMEMVQQDERTVSAASALRQVLGNIISIDHSSRFKLKTDQFQQHISAIAKNANDNTVILFMNGLLEKRSLGRGRIQFGKECLNIVGFDVVSRKIVYSDDRINRALNNNQLCTWESTEIRLERDALLHSANIKGFNPANNQNGTVYEVNSAAQFASLLNKKGKPFVYFDFGYNAAEDRNAVVISNVANYRTIKNARSADAIEDDSEAFGNRGHSCCPKN